MLNEMYLLIHKKNVGNTIDNKIKVQSQVIA